jgi:glycosyltransferase involved in cell wall biosynthesis
VKSSTPGESESSAVIRVAFYCDAHEVGGAEISLGHLVALLSARIEATILGTDPHLVERIARGRQGTAVVLLPDINRKRDVRAIAAHARAIRRVRPDVLHISLNRPWGSQWAVLAGLCTPKVKVVAVEKLPRQSRRLRHRIYKRLTSPRLDAHVTLGESAARTVAEISGVPRERITTIPSGVPDLPLEPLQRPSSGPVVGSIGRIEAQKGFDLLLTALTELPDVTAVVVGDGNERQRLIERSEFLGVSERVVFPGWSERARDYLTTFDVYVQPSRLEAQGISIVEAMFAGLPVVAADVGGVGGVVVHGETGWLVPPEDPPALAAAIRELLGDPARIAEMGRRGRQRALEHFSAELMAARFEALYRELAL